MRQRAGMRADPKVSSLCTGASRTKSEYMKGSDDRVALGSFHLDPQLKRMPTATRAPLHSASACHMMWILCFLFSLRDVGLL